MLPLQTLAFVGRDCSKIHLVFAKPVLKTAPHVQMVQPHALAVYLRTLNGAQSALAIPLVQVRL